MLYSYNPIICAIDLKDVGQALDLCRQIQKNVGVIKLGLEFFTINGPEGVKAIKTCGLPIFLDLKFHDIPNTVAQAVRSSINIGVDILTIHTSGGKTMMQAASNAAKEESARLGVKPPMIFGVTVLTSMDINDLREIGIAKDIESQVTEMARLAKESGLDGIVCSPAEIKIVKKEFGDNFKLIVPGIRLNGDENDDQKRVMTPAQAILNGADFIVVGRPITKAANPDEAAKGIFKEIEAFCK